MAYEKLASKYAISYDTIDSIVQDQTPRYLDVNQEYVAQFVNVNEPLLFRLSAQALYERGLVTENKEEE